MLVLFAVSAAFTALREAMNTEIMIRGMQQLSAASGASLVSMTQSFVTATDGMISFREAAEAVTKATTSGMGREQVMGIAEVAKGASQALGLNMGDAVSRLTRGITKLEPELLDELGIFTKLDKAVTDYARSVGKSESALTDFERRQAFANAVLKEGKDKFAEIAQEGNPYDKLLASLKNVAQQILSVVNTVIGPIAKILADNSTLIAGAIALLGANILTKAIPALNRYNQYLKDTADKAAKLATSEAQDAVAGQTKTVTRKMEAEYAKQVSSIVKERQELEQQLSSLDKKKAKLEDHLSLSNKITVLRAKETQMLRDQSAIISSAVDDRMSKKATFFGDTWSFMKEKIADMEGRKAVGLDIKQKVVETTEEQGPLEALIKLKDLLGKTGSTLGPFGKMVTAISSVFGILGQTILTVTRFFKNFIPYLGQAIALYELFQTFLSSNTKETQKLSESISELESTTKTATDVNQKYMQSMSIESVLAYSSSFNELTQSMQKTVTSFNDAKAAANWGDKAIDFLKEYIPLWDSLKDKAAGAMGAAVGAQIATLGDRPEGTAYKQDIAAILGFDPGKPVNTKTVTDALDSVFLSSEKFADIQQRIVNVTEAANKKFQEQTLYLRGLKDAAQNAEKSASSFMNSLKDTSTISTMMENNVKYLVQLDKALQSSDQRTRIAAVDSLKDANFGALFGTAASEIARLSDEFEELQGPADAASKELVKVKEKIEELQNKPLFFHQLIELENLERLKGQLDAVVKLAQDKAAQIAVVVSEAVSRSVKEQIAQTVQKFNLEMQKLAVDQAKFMASKAPVKTTSMIDYQAKLDKQAISIETQLITAQYDLADSIDRLNSTVKLEQDLRKKEIIERLGSAATSQQKTELAGINKRLGGTPDASGLMLSSGSMQAADNFLAKLNAGQLKGMSQADLVAEAQKLLSEFPEKMAQFNRALQNQLKKAGAAYKMQQVDITATIDKINLTAQQSIEKIDSEIQSINTAISNIGSDTPARIQLSMDAADLILSKELEKIEIQTQSKLDALSKLKLPDKEIASQKTRIDVEDTMARKKVEQAAAERKQENLAQKTLLTEKLKLETISKMAEAQKGLIIGEGLVFDQQRQALDRIIRQAQDSIELLNLEKALGTSQRKLNEFNAQFSTQAKRESMTPEERLQGNALATAVAEDKQILDTTRERQKLVGKGVEAQNSYNNLLAEQRTKLIEFDVLQDRQAARDAELTTNRTNQISKLEQELNIQQKLGFLTDRQIQVGQAGIALARIEIERDQELANIARERLRIEELINQEKQKPQAQVATDFTGELSPVKSDTMLQLEGQLQGITEKTAATQTKAQTATQSIMRDLDITPRMQKYSDSFNNYFQSMGDAIENWAKTGKFNSKELFNSLISDLARYEIKLAMTALYANAIRPLFNSALSFLGFGFQLPVGKAKGDVMMGGASLPGYAMGAVFDNGTVAKYARGGIVSQPTLFPMKKGMGLMGEAGPEAIMPLRKDSNGNLGVMAFARGGVLPVGRMPTGEMGINLSGTRSSRDSQPQYNHETVIHNYTGQQVTEQTSTNSRGGRRTEYFIGEAAAGETARNGGSMQNAIRNTYGLQPKLIRR